MVVEHHDPERLVVRVQGSPDYARLGADLSALLSSGPEQAHVDLADTDLVVGIGTVFTLVSAVAIAHHTRVTVHRASAEQRSVLRRFGLDSVLVYSDEEP
jgi:pentose-5-phosphate-3-epimerase|nr:hypothetical protein OH826_18250 [Streptomyces sp. NBC_00899]